MIFWIGCSADDARVGPRRTAIPGSAIYSGGVRNQLVSCGLHHGGLTYDAPWRAWAQALKHCEHRIVGLALAKNASSPSLSTWLSGPQRDVADYWMMTAYKNSAMVFFDIIEVATFQRPQVSRTTVGKRYNGSMFCNLTPWSHTHLMDAPCVGGGLMGSKFQQYVANHNLPDDAESNIVISMPVPHAVLCVSRVWSSWAFPYMMGSARSGHLFHLAQPLWEPLGDISAESLVPDAVDDALSPELLFDAANVLRTYLAKLPQANAANALADKIAYHVNWMQCMRDSLIHQAFQRKLTGAFDIEIIIKSVLMSGYLKNTGNMLKVLRHAVALLAAEPMLRSHLMSILDNQAYIVPSPTTLRRHRLTLNLGYCRWLQDVNETLLNSSDGVVRWGTLDKSPQKGWDWLLQGGSTITQDQLPLAYELSLKLCRDLTEREEVACLDALAKLIALSHGVPTAVGSGRSSLKYVVHALAHSSKLTSRSWPSVAIILNSTFTWTGDLGEKRISRFRGNLSDMFGAWITSHDEPDAAEFDFADEDELNFEDDEEFEFQAEDGNSPAVAAPAQCLRHSLDLDFTKSIFIMGVLHGLHNIVAGLSAVLGHWATYIVDLKHITRLLSRKWSKARLLETCFRVLPYSVFRNEIVAFNASVYDGRWGSALNAVYLLLPLARPLRMAWSMQAYSMGRDDRREANDGDDEKCANIGVADAAIKSLTFWGYSVMLDILAWFFLECSSFAEDCPCHWVPPSADGFSRRDRKKLFQERTRRRSCPMSGRRAPELAGGMLLSMLFDWLELCATTLLIELSVLGLIEESKAPIMRDFTQARRHIHFSFLLKFSFWQQLPWILFGVGHHIAQIATQCCIRAIKLFQDAGVAASHHWLTMAFCAPGSQGFEQLLLFASRQRDLHALPLLSKLAAKCRFALVAERWVEALHAANKHHFEGAPNAGAVHLAFLSMLKPMEAAIDSDANSLALMGRYCNETRNERIALVEMGFIMHPRIQQFIRDEAGRTTALARKHRPAVIEILYHIDSNTLFQDLPDIVVAGLDMSQRLNTPDPCKDTVTTSTASVTTHIKNA
jgi:hypothetical protein